MTGRRFRVAGMLAALAVAFVTPVPATAGAPQGQAKLHVVGVTADADRHVALAVRLDAGTPMPVPTTAFSVSPRSNRDPLRVSRRGARGLDLALVFAAAGPHSVRRAVRAAAAQTLLTLPAGSRVGVAGSAEALSTDTAASVLALRVDEERTIHAQLVAVLERFAAAPRESGRNRSLVLFDVGPYPTQPRAVLDLVVRAVASDVSVHVVRLTDGRKPFAALDELVSRTGGTLTTTDDPAGLEAAAERALADVQSRYDLRFRLPESFPSQVRVAVRHGNVAASTTVALPASPDPPVDTDLPPSSVMLVILVGAFATVLAFTVFVRLWVRLERSGD